MFKCKCNFVAFFCSVFLFCFLLKTTESLSTTKSVSDHVVKAREFVNETVALLESKNKTDRQKRQAVVDKYMSNINFVWLAKASLGKMYSQFSQDEKKKYISEFTKFFIYTWLPKLSFDKKSNLKVNVLDKSVKINDTDENITIVIKFGNKQEGDERKAEIVLRTRITYDTHEFQVLNLYFEEIDLATSYQVNFLSYIEEHKNDPRSIISYLQNSNKEKIKSVDFKISALPVFDLEK